MGFLGLRMLMTGGVGGMGWIGFAVVGLLVDLGWLLSLYGQV